MGRWRPSGSRQGAPAAAAAAVGLTVLALVAAGCTIRVRPKPTATTVTARPVTVATTAGAVAHGTTVARRAFTLVKDDQGARVGPARAGALPLAVRPTGGDFDQSVNIVLVFPLLRAAPRCLRQVELWLRLMDFRPEVRDEEPDLAAYPSQLVSLASDRLPGQVDSLETLLDNRPNGLGSRTADGAWLHFDLTQLYRTWAEGGPFPSLDRTIRRGTPLVVDVRAADLAQPRFEARVAPIGGDRTAAPQLRWAVARDC
jgi:hypothetical protein